MGAFGPDIKCPCPKCYACGGTGTVATADSAQDCAHCAGGLRCSKRGFSKCGKELIEAGKEWTPGVKVYRHRGSRTVECKIDMGAESGS